MKKYLRRTVPFILALSLIMSFPFYAAEGTAHAASGTRPVSIVMVGKRGAGNAAVVWAFSTAGVKVTTVYRLSKVKPSKYDGLIIPGGLNDVTPVLYGAKRSKKTYKPDRALDRLQIKAVKRFAKAGKPVFGICRGFQVINVAFGGTLKQHIGSHSGFRTVKNARRSWIRKVFGYKEKTYHAHHQGIKKLGKGLIATSYDIKSGEIEAFEHKSLPVYAVQWHPEAMTRYHPDSLRIFKAFRKICLRNRLNAPKKKSSKGNRCNVKRAKSIQMDKVMKKKVSK